MSSIPVLQVPTRKAKAKAKAKGKAKAVVCVTSGSIDLDDALPWEQ